MGSIARFRAAAPSLVAEVPHHWQEALAGPPALVVCQGEQAPAAGAAADEAVAGGERGGVAALVEEALGALGDLLLLEPAHGGLAGGLGGLADLLVAALELQEAADARQPGRRIGLQVLVFQHQPWEVDAGEGPAPHMLLPAADAEALEAFVPAMPDVVLCKVARELGDLLGRRLPPQAAGALQGVVLVRFHHLQRV